MGRGTRVARRTKLQGVTVECEGGRGAPLPGSDTGGHGFGECRYCGIVHRLVEGKLPDHRRPSA